MTAWTGADPQYRQAQDQSGLQRPRLDDARAFGGREAIRLAEADYSLAQDREHRMRDAAYAVSVPYQCAKGLAAELAAPAPDATAQRIADAIADHRLVAGMTLDEAMRAMGADPVLLGSSGPITHYRWKIVGRVGDTVEIHRDGFRRREVVVPQYGVVGHVTATFVDGRITDIFQDRG